LKWKNWGRKCTHKWPNWPAPPPPARPHFDVYFSHMATPTTGTVICFWIHSITIWKTSREKVIPTNRGDVNII
jgi:hypothetical protein